MAQSSEKLKRAAIANPPELSESHPEYGAYKQLAVGDREVFIRRLLREALEAFKKQLGE
jgi:hypothetical protein